MRHCHAAHPAEVPRHPEIVEPVAPAPVEPLLSSSRPIDPLRQSDVATVPVRRAALASTALIRGVRTDGKMTGMVPPPGT